MFCIKTDEGYICDYFCTEEGYYSYTNISPDIFPTYETVEEIAKSINNKTEKKVDIIELSERVIKTFESTKLTLKDLKPGDIFQFINNNGDNFVVIDSDFYIGLTEGSHKGKKYHIHNAIWTNAEVKKVKL